MKNYLNLLKYILDNGIDKADRTGVGTRSIFACQMRFNLAKGFPLLTTKAIHLPSVIYELLWFLSGDTNIAYLQKNGVRIWNEWADKNGNLGRIYGAQWRSWQTCNCNDSNDSNDSIDQISNVISQIKNNPDSRRLIVSAWNVAELEQMALAPCHILFQFYVANNRLSCQLYQRSADMFLGVPFNIASYALLTHMIAEQCGLKVGEFIWTSGDVHIYNNHFEQVKIQLNREPKPLPTLKIKHNVKDIFSYQYEDFEFLNYEPLPLIKAKVAV